MLVCYDCQASASEPEGDLEGVEHQLCLVRAGDAVALRVNDNLREGSSVQGHTVSYCSLLCKVNSLLSSTTPPGTLCSMWYVWVMSIMKKREEKGCEECSCERYLL